MVYLEQLTSAQYLDKRRDELTAIKSQLPGSNDMPALIRFRIVFPSGDPRRWPDVVVAPMRGRREG